MLQFLRKNKLKSVIFNNVKKVYKQNFFSLSELIIYLNWEALTKNVVILLKDGIGLMMKIFDIMRVH